MYVYTIGTSEAPKQELHRALLAAQLTEIT